jgi:hypothetical protein
MTMRVLTRSSELPTKRFSPRSFSVEIPNCGAKLALKLTEEIEGPSACHSRKTGSDCSDGRTPIGSRGTSECKAEAEIDLSGTGDRSRP